MKCETCGNPTKWVGSLMSGHLECEHCANDDACRSGGVEFAEMYAQEAQATGNPLTCGKGCSMNGGVDYCQCYDEPSLLKDKIVIDNKLNPYAKCSHCGNSIRNCMCKIQELTYQYLREIKGEFKC